MWRHLFRYLAVHKIAAVAAETVIAIVCLMGDAVPVWTGVSSWGAFLSWFGSAFLVAVTFQIFLHLRDVYDFQAKASSPDFLIRLGQALFLASAVLIGRESFLAAHRRPVGDFDPGLSSVECLAHFAAACILVFVLRESTF